MSLTLDMCTPGCTEPYGYGAQLSPRDQSAQEYLRQGTHVLTPSMLHTRALDDQSLQSEFYVSAENSSAPCMLPPLHPPAPRLPNVALSILCVPQQETPMNFVDPKEYNYPGLVRKNRYKTILPSK